MSYVYNLNLVVQHLSECVESAKLLIKNHSDRMEPWMLHRIENIISDASSDKEILIKHCPEVTE